MEKSLQYADSARVIPMHYKNQACVFGIMVFLNAASGLIGYINQSDFPHVVTTSPKHHRKIIGPLVDHLIHTVLSSESWYDLLVSTDT